MWKSAFEKKLQIKEPQLFKKTNENESLLTKKKDHN